MPHWASGRWSGLPGPCEKWVPKLKRAKMVARLSRITGGQTLKGIRYDMPVASAQVKSGILLAGLYAEGETSVTTGTHP